MSFKKANPPASFTRFYEGVKRVIENREKYASGGTRVLRLTRPSPKELSHLAELTPEFKNVVPDLIRSKWGPEPRSSSELLRRSGFYHGILAGLSEDELWSNLYGYMNPRPADMNPRPAEINTFLLLDGCAFPRDSFDLLGNVVIRHSDAEIADLGPPPEVAEAFFPNETLDANWFSRQWFLRDTESVPLSPPYVKLSFMDMRPSDFSGELVLDRYWAPLIALGLYDLSCFAIPVVLKSEAKWSLYRIRFSEPRWGMAHKNEEPIPVPTDDYNIADDEWRQFEAFLKFCEASITPKREWGSIRMAARHYLRATFCCDSDGDAHTRENREDALLQYNYGLESLLLAGDREAITDKIATRAALVAGEDDNDRRRIYAFVKKAYRARGNLAHGKEEKIDTDLRTLRDVYRRVMVVILAVARRCKEPKELNDIIKELPIARDKQDEIAKDRNEVFSLVKAMKSSRWSRR